MIWHDVTTEKDLLAERERQLLVDALTGIPNRRAAEKAIEVEDARRRRADSALAFAVIEVDHFERVNDTFGHQVGDEVLKLVANQLAAQARITDTVARCGGEEFLAVLPVSLDGAIAFAERLRGAIEAMLVPRAGRVTVSIGVAEAERDEAPSDAIGRADRRLYDAKRGGRNRVQS